LFLKQFLSGTLAAYLDLPGCWKSFG